MIKSKVSNNYFIWLTLQKRTIPPIFAFNISKYNRLEVIFMHEIMDLIKFQEKFNSEQACEEFLFHIYWPNGYRCPRWGHDKYSYHFTRKLYQCKQCKYQTLITAGTIFHKTRTPLRKWFWIIFVIVHNKTV